MNYYKSGLHNSRLLKAYAYDKKKKELRDVKKEEDNTQERCESQLPCT